MKKIKYLGVTINDDMNDSDDTLRKSAPVYIYGKGNLVIQKFRGCSDDVKLCHFRTFCYNV